MMSGPSMELRALVHRGFRPVSWKFEERWYQFANALAAQLRFVPIDLGWTKQAGVNCTPKNVGSPTDDSHITQPAVAARAPMVLPTMAPHKLATCRHSSA